MEKLACLFCQKKYPLDLFFPFCPRCREPLLISYPPRKRAFSLDHKSSLEKFLAFLPLSRFNTSLSLGEGNTPLLELNRLRRKHNLPLLLAKNEIINPTQSFKDRGTAVAVQKAFASGIKRIGTVSTGNMAASTAAYGAKAGFKTFVFLKEDSTMEKVLSTGIHGPVLIKVKGDYGRLFWESFRLGRSHKIYFMNSVDPVRLEGYKITGYEIFFQLDSRAPHYIFVPVSSGGHLVGLIRAFLDLKQERIIDKMPVFVGVQAKGCSPLAKAFKLRKDRFQRIHKPETIAHAISNPDPPAGNLALKLSRENQGLLVSVTDAEILTAQKELAELEGIFCDPASATTLAGLRKLRAMIRFHPRDTVVLVITGSGLKSMETITHHDISVHKSSLPRLEQTLISLV